MVFGVRRAVSLLLVLAAVGCSREEDKAAVPFVEALATLGLGGVTYERAFREPDGFRLVNAKASFRGQPVAIAEIQGRGFTSGPQGWSASRIAVIRAEGDVSAADLVVITAKGPAGTDPGSGTYAAIVGLDVRARLMGLPLRIARLDASGAGRARSVEADGLRLNDGYVGTSAILDLAKGIPWRLRAVATADARDALVIDVSELNSGKGLVSGRLILDGLGPDPVGRLPAMDAWRLFSPSTWPDGVTLREARIAGALAGPFPASLRTMRGEDFADPYVRGLVVALSGMLGADKVAGEVTARPRAGVPVLDLGVASMAPDAANRLGLSARVDGVPPSPLPNGGHSPSR